MRKVYYNLMLKLTISIPFFALLLAAVPGARTANFAANRVPAISRGHDHFGAAVDGSCVV